MDAPPSIRLREPLGERRVDSPLVIGGADDDPVRVPGAAASEALRFEWRGDGWHVQPARIGGSALLVNGERFAAGGGHELRAGDVFAIGQARVLATRLEPAALELDVRHLVGNDTVAPLAAARARADAEDAADVEIVAAALDLAEAGGAGADGTTPSGLRRGSAAANRRLILVALAICGVALAFLFGIVGRLQRVAIEVDPGDTRVTAAARVSWYSAPTLFVLPGEHAIRGEREGYAPLVRRLEVRAGQGASLALRLTRLPGVVAIDTGGVPATVTVDGADAGRAPGELSIAAGERTLTLRAERHLDVIEKIVVEGGGARQELAVRFQPSWGKLAVSVTTPGAVVATNGAAAVPLPATLDLPAGVHRLSITAPGAREWASSVLVKAGETTTLGPLTLGAPDARLTVRSQPAGAEVTIAGAFRGRTPLEIALPGGTDYDVLVTRAGHATWQRRISAQSGAQLALDARLQPIMATLTVRGEPADAEVFVDGTARGRAPATIELLATRHQLEVRRAGSQPFRAEVDLTAALARTIDYTLTPEGRAPGWKPPTENLTTKLGQALRLVPAGTFSMGSERREQGRRPNETLRRVTLSRPFYLGTREVTNAEFRRFRPNHGAGFVDKRSIDLDAQAVTGVGWADAVAYCNWLSEQDGLPPAYEQKDGGWALRTPATTGYRLPTEAEWEYAARHGGAGKPQRRYDWGDALPVPPGHANLAGAEAATAVERMLDGWRDDYQAVAPTGKHPPNALGLHDMSGNVSEWTHDVYASFIEPAPVTDPLGPATAGARRVIKGSSWRTASFGELRAAWREGAEQPSQDIGFRIARHVD